MRPRAWVFAATGVLGGAACAFVACSSHAPGGFTSDDAGGDLDSTMSDDVAAPFDSAPLPILDAGPDTAPTPLADANPPLVGHCEPVQGPACDLVLQNCPSVNGVPQQCLLAGDGALTTACTPVVATQHLVKGHGCCPGSNVLQCDQGLECIGDPNASCDGGGPPPGRCTPHCCGGDAGDDYLCGNSDPEGYPGHCDTVVVDGNGNPLYNACTYDLACKPFHIQSCPSGSVCEVVDTSGTAACDTIYLPNGGSPPTEGQFCLALNNCADGLVCLGPVDAGACYMMCLTPGSSPPFDAGALDGGPYYGGCPANEQCNIPVDGFPPWISFCGAPP